MKQWRFVLPLGVTAAAIAVNVPGFIIGGPRPGWVLAVTAGYLAVWLWYLLTVSKGWQRTASKIWWIATAACAAVCVPVSAGSLDLSWVILPALGLISPLSGLAVLTGTNYPVFYGVCTLLAAGFSLLCWKKR